MAAQDNTEYLTVPPPGNVRTAEGICILAIDAEGRDENM